MISRLPFMIVMVALVLPHMIPFNSGPVKANPNSSDTTLPRGYADPQNAGGNCLPTLTSTPIVYYGVYVPGWLDNLDALLTFEKHGRKKVSIVMLYQGWGVTNHTRNFQTNWMDNIRTHGSIPMVSWEPWLYTAGVNQPQFQLADIINGNFDSYIQKWADASKSWGHPYFLRFAAEMNGNWFPWSEGVNGNRPGEYVKAWQHVHDIFTSRGVTNVTWVWSPNVEYNGSLPLEGLFPGDDYVDWLGMDGYNWGTEPHGGAITGWQTFSEVFGQTYTHITALSAKPLMVAETASTEQGGSKAAWISDAYSTQILCNFRRIKAVIGFNENKETNWRIESSMAAQSAFARAVQPCFYGTNQYASLNRTPIPVPVALARQKCATGIAQDGWVLESTETSNKGGSMNNTAGVLRIGDDNTKKQYRTILSFKTGGLPDNVVITSAKLQFQHHSVKPAGTNPIALFQGIYLDIRNGYFGTQPTLQLMDFRAPASITIGPFKPVLSGGWYSINLPNTMFAHINKRATNGGITQFRLPFALDDNNNTIANVLNIISGNNAIQAKRPELIIGYNLP